MTTSTSMKSATASASSERQQLLESFEISLDAAGLSPATLRLYGFGIRKLYAFPGPHRPGRLAERHLSRAPAGVPAV